MIDLSSVPVKQRMYKLCDDKTEAHLRTALNRMLQYKELNRLLCGGLFIITKMRFMFKLTIDMIMLKKQISIESTLF